MNAIEQYHFLRNEVDTFCNKLHQEHECNTKCRLGCDQCCMNFRVLPIEFYAMLREIKSGKHQVESEKLKGKSSEDCIFLQSQKCAIYESRPFICRSHGLPILAMDAEGDNWELSFCPLNFSNVDDDYFSFENSYDQDTINSKLYQINQEFLKTEEGRQFENEGLIEVSKLKEFLTEVHF